VSGEEADQHRPPFGSVPLTDETVQFRVWAPNATKVAVRLSERGHRLRDEGDGVFAAEVPAVAGDDYTYVLDGERELADPCSRFQPYGVSGPSRIVDPGGFAWTDDDWPGLVLGDLVLYELHVGAFTRAGTFAAVCDRLPALKELGVTAIQLMPVATFPGSRNWGYDGVYTFAPHPVYGDPQALAGLVDAAHGIGLGVLLDVVYNHIGPGSERISAFGPYFTDAHETAWGDALDYSRRGVREWAAQNAEMWVRDFHVDGLRLDAVDAIHDDSRPHILAELAERVRLVRPTALVTSETEPNDLRPITEWGHDAQWADETHHLLHVLLTGEQDGYYEAYRPSVEDLGRQLRRRPPERLIVASQNHDQVGNRAFGDRPDSDELRIRAVTILLALQTPLLFMGEEYGERRPFQFFTDHPDPAIAEATRSGRRREFARFSSFAGGDLPDPQDPETFERSKLDPSGGDPSLRALYQELLSLRRRLPRRLDVEADEEAMVLRLRRGPVEALLNFAERDQEDLPAHGVDLRDLRRSGS
jgi:maltooligosyltrehalose trehalohydrolase